MSDKTIPLQAVSDALMCTVVKLKTKGRELTGKPHARTAAFTQVPSVFCYRCRDARRGYSRNRQIPYHFSPMDAGDMDQVLLRTRLRHGLAEVRRTWGAGMRQLQAEFDGGMR